MFWLVGVKVLEDEVCVLCCVTQPTYQSNEAIFHLNFDFICSTKCFNSRPNIKHSLHDKSNTSVKIQQFTPNVAKDTKNDEIFP